MRGGRVYVSYAAADRDFAERLFRHLTSLKDEDGVATAGRDGLTTGADEKRAAGAEIEAATVGVLLVSSDFLDETYVREHELPPLQRRHSEGSLALFAVRLRP